MYENTGTVGTLIFNISGTYIFGQGHSFLFFSFFFVPKYRNRSYSNIQCNRYLYFQTELLCPKMYRERFLRSISIQTFLTFRDKSVLRMARASAREGHSSHQGRQSVPRRLRLGAGEKSPDDDAIVGVI